MDLVQNFASAFALLLVVLVAVVMWIIVWQLLTISRDARARTRQARAAQAADESIRLTLR